jgi:hypothetical protein
MNNVFEEGNLIFDFNDCGTAERFDVKGKNPDGMKSVDFVVETTDCMYFIEVKDYQNPCAPQERREIDFNMLISAVKDKESVFIMEMGAKIKDSLLRKYAENHSFTKKIVYLLFINLDKLGEFERGMLKAKISGHVPTGLNHSRFNAFTGISFNLVNIEQIIHYGIVCKNKI